MLFDDLGIYAEEVFLYLVCIAYEATFVVVRATGHSRYDTGDASCGATFSCREGFAFAPQDFVDFFTNEFEI
ncbi:hypothetical protein EVA_19191 [gut metagenome]|uniref:Uncharacterized protein n=1 Tax=gut metagenome TaxID=749906 RepID=J9FCT0_9ZZZZ